LTDAFSTFLTTLHTKFSESSDDIEDIIDDLTDAGIDKLMTAIGSFITPCMQLGSGKFQVGDQVIDIPFDTLKKGAANISILIASLLDGFIGWEDKYDDDDFEDIPDYLEPLMTVVDMIKKIPVGDDSLEAKVTSFKDSMGIIEDMFIKKSLDALTEERDKADMFRRKMRHTALAFEYMTSVDFKRLPTSFDSLVSSLNRMDNELQSKSTQRSDSLKKMKNDFTGVRKAAKELNRQLEQLRKIEKVMIQTNRDEFFKKWENMMELQTKQLKEAAQIYTDAVNEFQENVTNANINVSVSPTDIANGIEMANYSFVADNKGKTFTKS